MAVGRGLGTLTLALAIQMAGFTAGLDKAGRELDSKTKRMEKRAYEFGRAIGTSMKLAAAAFVSGVGAFTYAMKSAIDQADQLNEISKKIGIPTDVLSGLNYAAKLSGIATEELQAGLVKMVRFQSEAAKGAKEGVKVFSTLGIAIKDSTGHLRNSDEVFRDFAEIFKRLPDGAEKTALAVKVFGRSGAELIPLLNEGKSGLAGFADELDKLGGTVTPEAAAAADQFNDDLDRLKVAFGGVALQVATDLLPELNKLTSSFVANAKEGGTVANVADSIAGGFRFMGDAASFAVTAVQALTSTGIGLYEVLKKISALNPGVVVAKLFGQLKAGNAGVAFEQANELIFGGPSAAAAARATAGSRARGGRGMGADSAPAPNISALFLEGEKSGKKAKEQLSEAEKAAKALEEAYQRMSAQMKEQIALFGQTTEVAKVRYDIEHGELSKLSEAKKAELLQSAAILDQLKAEEDLLKERNKLEEERLKLIEDARTALADTLSDMQFELDLMKLSNAERIAEIELRRIGKGLSAEEAAAAKIAIRAKAEEIEQMQKSIDAMDNFRSSVEDAFVSFLDGSKSAKDAFKDLADSILQQIIRIQAQKLVTAMFGEQGTTGGGGWFGALFSAFAGAYGGSSGSTTSSSGGMLDWISGGYAGGTNYAPGGMALVGEHGPEIVNLPRGSQVIPNDESRRMMGKSVVVNMNITGTVTREVAQYAANTAARRVMAAGRGS